MNFSAKRSTFAFSMSYIFGKLSISQFSLNIGQNFFEHSTRRHIFAVGFVCKLDLTLRRTIFTSIRALNRRIRCAFCNVYSQSCWSWFNCFSFQDDIALLVCIILIMALTVFVVIIKVVIIITIICTRPKPARNYSFFEKNMCDLLPKPTIQNLQF